MAYPPNQVPDAPMPLSMMVPADIAQIPSSWGGTAA